MTDIFKSLNFKHIIFNDQVYTKEVIASAVDALLKIIHGNVNHGSPFIYLFAHNHLKTIIAYLAIIKAGYIAVLVDPDIKTIEVNDMLYDTPPSAIIRIKKEKLDLNFQEEIIFQERVETISCASDMEDVCTIVYTAADDGYPKAVMLTRTNMLSNAESIVECDRINKESVCCSLLPMHHTFGLQTAVLAPLMASGSVLIEDINGLKTLCNIQCHISKYAVTNVYSIPMIYYLLSAASEFTEDTLKSVVSFVSGGYKLSESIFHTFLEKSGKEIHEGYGLTEAAPVCTWHRPDDPIKLDSVGRSFSCCEIKILDDHNTECDRGEIGEICVKGQNVMKGYYHHDTATISALQNGWLHTGDLGNMDENGFVYLTGLKKRMLNVGGKNVYPAEVERLMRFNGNVEEVQVYGGKSKLMGNIVKVKVRLRKNSFEEKHKFEQWCTENISRYKLPKKYEYL